MWRPDEVVPRSKRRAIALWVVMIIAIIAYAITLVYEATEKSKNPSTSLVLSSETYKYPDVYVCLFDYYGCDTLGLEEACLNSILETEGGMPSAVLNPDNEDSQTLEYTMYYTGPEGEGIGEGNVQLDKGWCIGFHASALDVSEGDIEDNVILNVHWYPGGVANNSTTCIQEEGEWEDHSESVSVFLVDDTTNGTGNGTLSAGIQVPYTCMTNLSSSHIFNYMAIGLTETHKLNGSESGSIYKAVSTTAVVRKDKRDADITEIQAPYAWLSMELAQATDSKETITEIDPIEVLEMFGNIGGFWDLLLILWPLFFIATAQQGPHLKGRNCKKSVLKGKDHAKSLTTSVATIGKVLAREHPLRRRESARVVLDATEIRPAWDNAPTHNVSLGDTNDVSFSSSHRDSEV